LGNFLIPRPRQYYLDFCFKYNFIESNKESLPHFVKKLKDKKQTAGQQKQASHAISLYYDLLIQQSGKRKPFKNKNEHFSSEKNRLKESGADWSPVYYNLDSEIKLRHYSPKTLYAYRGWARQLQGFTKMIYTHTIKSQTIKEAKSPLNL